MSWLPTMELRMAYTGVNPPRLQQRFEWRTNQWLAADVSSEWRDVPIVDSANDPEGG